MPADAQIRRRRRPAPAAAALALSALCLAAAACGPRTPSPGGAVGGDGAGVTPVGATAAITAPIVSSSGAPTLSAPEALGTQRTAGKVPVHRRSFGGPGFDDGQLQLPTAVAVDAAGNVYVSDSVGVQVFDADGRFVRRIGAGDLVAVEGVAVTADGSRLYVATREPPVRVFDAAGAPAGTVGTPGDGPGQLAQPAALALDGDGRLYVADAANGRVEVFEPSGRHARTIGEKGGGRGQFTQPRALAVGADGRVYVGTGDSYAIQVFGPDGAYEKSLAHGYKDATLYRIAGLALDDAGRLYASEAASHYVQVFADGAWVADLGKLGSATAQFNTPTGLAYAAGALYVVDQQNSRVQVFTTP